MPLIRRPLMSPSMSTSPIQAPRIRIFQKLPPTTSRSRNWVFVTLRSAISVIPAAFHAEVPVGSRRGVDSVDPRSREIPDIRRRVAHPVLVAADPE
jgi:hypothetical protein